VYSESGSETVGEVFFGEGRNWRDALDDVFIAVDHLAPELAQVTRFNAVLRKIEALSPALADEVSNVSNDQCTELIGTYGRIGFALARTWPTRLEDLDDWGRRAMEYAGVVAQVKAGVA
jgi:hypothetical protein